MFQLRPHQQEVFSLMRQHSKMLTVAPTSSGKTIMMIADAKHRFTEGESNKTILVVAPKLILCQQLSNEFEKFIDNQEANMLLTRKYRYPYVIPQKV